MLEMNSASTLAKIFKRTERYRSMAARAVEWSGTSLLFLNLVRLKIFANVDALFISNTGAALCYDTVSALFRQMSRKIGLRGGPGQPGPRIHDLRHTFAVRSLESCPHDDDAVSRHVLALSTYLGHAHVADTYWYLQATPGLMAQIADAGEAFGQAGAQ